MNVQCTVNSICTCTCTSEYLHALTTVTGFVCCVCKRLNLLCSFQGNDLCELRRHAYSNSVDPYSIKRLIQRVFPACKCRELKSQSQQAISMETDQDPSPRGSHSPLPLSTSHRCCTGHEVAFPIEAMELALDVKEECLATLLCYLELRGWIDMLSPGRDVCSLKCYGGARQLRALARKVPAVAAAVAWLRNNGETSHVPYMCMCT